VFEAPTLPETTSLPNAATLTQSNTKENNDDDVMIVEDDDAMEVTEVVPNKLKDDNKSAINDAVFKDVPVPKKPEINDNKKKEPRRIALTSLQPVPAKPAVAPSSGETTAAQSSGGKRRVQLISVAK
jgi:hypothetical protein